MVWEVGAALELDGASVPGESVEVKPNWADSLWEVGPCRECRATFALGTGRAEGANGGF